jgi:hypothetical protein
VDGAAGQQSGSALPTSQPQGIKMPILDRAEAFEG